MLNSKPVSKYLKEIGEYPLASGHTAGGLTISAVNDQLMIAGAPCNLIDLADLLVSLALSGENSGQHWHLDEFTLISENSPIGELVIEREEPF